MKAVLLLLCALLVFVAAEEAVFTLTTENFDSWVKSKDVALVEFYAPWCGHCKHLAPEYEKAAQELHARDPPIYLGKVDATEHGELAGRFNVRGYPTLFVFKNGKESEYKGPREARGIVNYMVKQASPVFETVSTADALTALKKKNADATVIIYTSNKDSPLFKQFQSAANADEEGIVFGQVTDSSLFGDNAEKIVLYRKTDDATIVFDSSRDLLEWINTNAISIGGEFTRENAKRYASTKLPVLKYFFSVDRNPLNAKHLSYYARRLQKAGKDFANKLLFSYSDRTTFEHDLQGIDGDVVLIEDANGKKYVSKEKFSIESVTQFANDFLAGKLKPSIKSEEVPESNNGPVKVVVGSTFDDIVLDPSKNVLIEFYAPWCGHCKTLAPKYEELGSKFQGSDDVVIAKIDATANDFPQNLFDVSGYPTLYFKPAGANGTNRIKRYDGGREVSQMKEFIKREVKAVKAAKEEL